MSCGGGCGGGRARAGPRSMRSAAPMQPGARSIPSFGFPANMPTPSHRPVQIAVERDSEMLAGPEQVAFAGLRFPGQTRQSTPAEAGYPSPYEAFNPAAGAGYNISFIPKDVNVAEFLGQSRMRRAEPYAQPEQTFFDPNARPQIPQEFEAAEGETSASKKHAQKRMESLMEWFDRSVEKELKKYKESTLEEYQYPGDPLDIDPSKTELNISKGVLERVAGATASQVDICFDLRKEPDTDLNDAVDKLAKAEAMCEFAGAVKAAEAAADAAPPELAEEAALASARGFKTNLKATTIHGDLAGERPIEIVGYIGVTKPTYPAKRK